MQGAALAGKNIFYRHLDSKFNLPDNAYKPIDKIGTGAYGIVWSALHRKSGEKVAIKKIPNAFQELTTAKRTYRELKILRHFEHENIIGIREILNPREGVSELKDVYVVMDLMESDLHQIIHSTQPFSLEHIRYFLYQLLRGLKHIHSANVVHRDLKPSNLLVNENCELKIGDFGMARGISSHQDAGAKKKVFMTAYVATRWYRAPELLFSNDIYSYAVDTWSVGCIFAEMMGRKQIFPGKNPMHQLTLIVEALGMPPDYMLKSTNSEQIYNFFHKNFSNHKPVDFHAKYPGANKKAIDLLSKMLVFNPADRISIQDALKHPFLSKYHDPDDEPDCFPPFDFSFEHEDLKKEQIRQRVGKMILKYQKNVFGPPKLTLQPKSDPATANDLPFQASKDPVSQPAMKPATVQQQPLQPMVKDTQSTIFKKPAAPISHTQTITDLKHSMKPQNDPLDIMRGLCVKTEQGIPTSSTDVVMKSASLESHPTNVPLNQNLFAASVQTSTTSIIPSDFPMSSAGSQKEPDSSKQPSKNTNLTVSPKEQTTPTVSDVEMKSAKETPPVSSNLSNNLGDLSTKLQPPVEDVAMHSAGIPKDIPGVKEETKLAESKTDVQIRENTMSAVLGITAGGDNQIASKTISDDTKALIKAALLNSALKNKLRKDSTSGLCSKGGGKVTVTAQSRQREREEKRRQKLKRSQEKQKKTKSKGQGQENAVVLTAADKDLLEKWKKMQQKAPVNSQSKRRLHSESSLPANDENKPATQPQQTVTETSKVSNASVPVLSKTNRGQVAPQSLLGTVKNVQQINMAAALATDTRTMPNQRRIMPKVSSAITSTAIVTSGTSLPSTLTYQITVGQNIGNPSTSQNASVFASSVAGSGIPVLSNPVNNQPQVMTFALPQNPGAGISGLNNFQQEKNTASFQPITSVPNKTVPPQILPKENSPISDDKTYRSRIISDRETPSPPLAVSPPTYEEAVKAKQKNSAKKSSEEQDFPLSSLGSLDDISPFKPSPTAKLSQAASLPFDNESSNQDLTSLLQNLDILPPTLALTPKGDGAGYGLDLDFAEFAEDLLLGRTLDLPNVGHPPSASRPLDTADLSPSLMSDWLDVRFLNKDEMQKIQQDVGMTSPFNIPDLGGLGNISPPTKS